MYCLCSILGIKILTKKSKPVLLIDFLSLLDLYNLIMIYHVSYFGIMIVCHPLAVLKLSLTWLKWKRSLLFVILHTEMFLKVSPPLIVYYPSLSPLLSPSFCWHVFGLFYENHISCLLVIVYLLLRCQRRQPSWT